jgi:hypothetical protein
MNNGALDEAMEIMKGSLADNSEVEQPYRTKGKIFLDENGSIDSIYINGIIVDFDIIIPIESCNIEESDKALIDRGWKKVYHKKTDLIDWIMTDEMSSIEWDGKDRNYFDF